MKYKLQIFCAVSLVVGGCGQSQPVAQLSGAFSDDKIRSTIVEEARKLGIVDGFYFGEESRNFKTEYSLTSPELKARWAMDYMSMLSHAGENMIKDWQSYVPYHKRAAFAQAWWLQHDPAFARQNKKMQIVWIHESLLDGGELWFRAVEKLAQDKMDSVSVLTHDEEQRLVSKYAENDHSEGSLSTQSDHFR